MTRFPVGTRVITNNLEWGTVERLGTDNDPTGPWHTIRLDNGGTDLMNDARLTTRHPFGDPDPKS